jgi:hypothetical protein
MRRATMVILVVLALGVLASTASAALGVPGPTPNSMMFFRP